MAEADKTVEIVNFTYDAGGLPLTLTYRSYVLDQGTGLYYLQSRYYDFAIGRFINADTFTTTGQGLLGNNMFAYCNNNPIRFVDTTGSVSTEAIIAYLTAVLPYVISGLIAGGLMGAASYLLSIGFSDQTFDWLDFGGSILIGCLSGAVGGLAGPAELERKFAFSAIAGTISGIYSGINTDGSGLQKALTGCATGLITAFATYGGATIDAPTTSALATAFSNYCISLLFGMQAELANRGVTELIDEAAEFIEEFLNYLSRIVKPSNNQNAKSSLSG